MSTNFPGRLDSTVLDSSLPQAKEGVNTSSFKLVVLMFGFVAIIMTVPLIVAIAVAQGWITEEMAAPVRAQMIEALIYAAGVLGFGGLAGAALSIKAFIDGRAKVSVVRAQAQAAATTGVVPLAEGSSQTNVTTNVEAPQTQ